MALLRVSVNIYLELQNEVKEIKSVIKSKQREMDTVLAFFNQVEPSFIDIKFPLFSETIASGDHERAS